MQSLHVFMQREKLTYELTVKYNFSFKKPTNNKLQSGRVKLKILIGAKRKLHSNVKSLRSKNFQLHPTYFEFTSLRYKLN